MRRGFVIAVLLICSIAVKAQSENPKFDQALATKLGADDYGMKMYVLVMLKTGTAAITDKKIIDSLFKGHFNNMQRLTEEGKLIVAGPMEKNDKNYRGLFILNVRKIEDARLLVDTDPAVKSKMLDADYLPWYGSAALSEYLPYHERVEKKKM
ncbi:MAG: YciI family protein [Bacteroidota bacterium]